LPSGLDVGGIEPDQVRAKQAAKTFSFPFESDACSNPLDAVVGCQSCEGEPVRRLGVARNPGRMEGFFEWNRDMKQFDAVDFNFLSQRANINNLTNRNLAAQSRCYL
jgi:hypothetical protein